MAGRRGVGGGGVGEVRRPPTNHPSVRTCRPVDCLDVSSFFIAELPRIDKVNFSTTTWFTVDGKYLKSIIFLTV